MKDQHGRTIYHTNVISWVGTEILAICWVSIPDGPEKDRLKAHVSQKYPVVIDLSMDEVNSFSGNALEVTSKSGDRYLTISTSGYKQLSEINRTIVDNHYAGRVISVDVSNIQRLGGGSVRCMEAKATISAATAQQIMSMFQTQFSESKL